MITDPNVEKVRELLLQRSQVGIEKYGTTTDRDDLKLEDWLRHALEETLDKAVYLQAALTKLEEERRNPNQPLLINTDLPRSPTVEIAGHKLDPLDLLKVAKNIFPDVSVDYIKDNVIHFFGRPAKAESLLKRLDLTIMNTMYEGTRPAAKSKKFYSATQDKMNGIYHLAKLNADEVTADIMLIYYNPNGYIRTVFLNHFFLPVVGIF